MAKPDLVAANSPDGKPYWLARDPDVEGPYGVGSTEAEAVQDLVGALAFWRKHLKEPPAQFISTSAGLRASARIVASPSRSETQAWTIATAVKVS